MTKENIEEKPMAVTHVPFVDLSRIHKPLTKELTAAFSKILENGDFILGEEVGAFEKDFTEFTGAKFGIGVASGSDGLLLSLLALGIGPGDEVIVPSHTFIATALAVTYARATPVFADIDEETFNLSPKEVQKRITKKTKAILPVCLYGQPVDFDELTQLAKKNNLKLIIDACQAHGTYYKEKPMGAFGDAVVYSFYPGKNLGALGDGGFVTSNIKAVADKIVLLRNIGRNGWYSHPVKGYNSRLDTLQAAFLRIKLKHLDQWNAARAKSAEVYHNMLQGLPLTLPIAKPNRTHGYHLYVVRVDNREKFIEYLKSHGVHASIHYPIPIHKQKAYKDVTRGKIHLKVSEKVAREVVSLPMFVGITKEEQEYVAKIIRKFFKETKN